MTPPGQNDSWIYNVHIDYTTKNMQVATSLLTSTNRYQGGIAWLVDGKFIESLLQVQSTDLLQVDFRTCYKLICYKINGLVTSWFSKLVIHGIVASCFNKL